MECEIKIDEKKNKIYAPLKEQWFVKTPEEEVRQLYVCRLVNHYGFSLDQMKQEVTVSNSSRGQGRAQDDIVIWKSKKNKNEDNSPVIVVECKAENITIREGDCFQGTNYASWAGADFFVTTNLKETRIFKAVKGKIPKRLEKIIDIPDAKIAIEIKAKVKTDIYYQIPIAEVKKAGISTTGAKIENELIPLAEEFTKYRKKINTNIDSGIDDSDLSDKLIEKIKEIIIGTKKYSLLPDNVVGYYSGLSEIMQELVEPHNELISTSYRKNNTLTERDFFYFKPEHFGIYLFRIISKK